MKKRIVSLVVFTLMLFSFSSVFAAPDTLAADASGNFEALVVTTRPAGSSDMTFDNSYVISGYGVVGTVVTIYSYNAESGLYEKLYKTVTTVGENGVTVSEKAPVSCVIGDSTLFMTTVNLNSGSNSFMLYAENDDMHQIAKFFVLKHNYNIMDVIRSWGTV